MESSLLNRCCGFFVAGYSLCNLCRGVFVVDSLLLNLLLWNMLSWNLRRCIVVVESLLWNYSC